MAKNNLLGGRSVTVREVAGRGVVIRSGREVAGFNRIIDCIDVDDVIIDAEFEVVDKSATASKQSANAANAAAKMGADLKELKFADSSWASRLIEEFQFLNKISSDEAAALKRELGL